MISRIFSVTMLAVELWIHTLGLIAPADDATPHDSNVVGIVANLFSAADPARD